MATVTANPNVQLFGFNELLDYAAQQTGQRADYILNQINPTMKQLQSTSLTFSELQKDNLAKLLKQNGFTVTYNGNDQWSAPLFQEMQQTTIPNPVNSNLGQTFRGWVRNKYGMVKEFDGNYYTLQASRFPVSGGLGQKAQYLIGSAGSALMAVSAGIKLGKAIDGALYNANPQFWENIGWGTINPETWGSITNGDDSPFAGMLNFVLGIDPENNNAQMYMDQETLAYLAFCMAQNGVFSPSTDVVNAIGTYTYNNVDVNVIKNPILVSASFVAQRLYGESSPSLHYGTPTNNTSPVYCFALAGSSGIEWYFFSANSFSVVSTLNGVTPSTNSASMTSSAIGVSFYSYYAVSYYSNFADGSTILPQQVTTSGRNIYEFLASSNSSYVTIPVLEGLLLDNDVIETGSTIEGIENQSGATLPDVSSWDTPANTLASLQQQYPDWFNNAMVWGDDAPDSDTIGRTKTYIPVPFPYIGTNANQPTSINPDNDQEQQTQNETELIPDVTPSALTEIIAQIIQQTKTQTETETEQAPDNPTDTGTGTTDPPLLPTGNASALWSVYHPTQAQVNSFGAWLWSDDFLTNILKIMNDPMSGIITLHKVFAPPVDSGTGTIVVGKLDSEVPSATVNQQYVTVDCGSVDLLEQFGNVFDYNPYTDVSLYLPFIGIVPLDTADVMRSTIHVTYGVDVYTGACLAQVEVTRDGNSVNMYQYSGVCSVEYPLTGGQHSGLISGLLGLGLGIASGNVPMAIGGAAASFKVHQSRANSFSGNAGAMGIKTPYLIISRPQTKVAQTFPELQGFPTNASVTLSQCSGQVRVRAVHVEGINATESELREIESLLISGVLV